MRWRRKRTLISEPLVNLTPLIDVVFVVLIVFILIAPMISIDHISLAGKTQAKSTTIDERKELVLRLHSDGTLSINKKIIPKEKWSEALVHANKGHKRALLLCDKRAMFGEYQGIKDALELAGFEELDIAVSPKR